MTDCTTVITSAKIESDSLFLEFESTVFFPTGGGQSCDIGTVSIGGKTYAVTDVSETDDGKRILHKIEPCTGDSALPSLQDFPEGAQVSLSIDWAHRFDNMQRHCGEHLLSGVFHREYGGVNRGFHMGDDYMTIDISLEDDPAYNTLTWEMAKHAELCANEIIWQNVPVMTEFFATKDDAKAVPFRKKLAIEKDITVVFIGDKKAPYDCVACCGTHPSSTGQIGLIKIRKIEPNKGMFRVYFDTGRRAFVSYQKEFDIITAIANAQSSGIDELPEKLSARAAHESELHAELAEARKMIAESRRNEISKALAEPGKIVVQSYQMKANDVFNIGKPFIGNTDKLLILVSEPENTVILISDGKTYDCGKLVKENAGIYGGKGGGKPDNARALFPKAEYIETYIDLLDKHLR